MSAPHVAVDQLSKLCARDRRDKCLVGRLTRLFFLMFSLCILLVQQFLLALTRDSTLLTSDLRQLSPNRLLVAAHTAKEARRHRIARMAEPMGFSIQ